MGGLVIVCENETPQNDPINREKNFVGIILDETLSRIFSHRFKDPSKIFPGKIKKITTSSSECPTNFFGPSHRSLDCICVPYYLPKNALIIQNERTCSLFHFSIWGLGFHQVFSMLYLGNPQDFDVDPHVFP